MNCQDLTKNGLTLKPKCDNLSFRTTSTISPTNLMVGNVIIQLDCVTALDMGRKKNDHSHPESMLSSPASNGISESGSSDLWLKCLDGNTIPSDQILFLGRNSLSVFVQHHKPNEPQPPLLFPTPTHWCYPKAQLLWGPMGKIWPTHHWYQSQLQAHLHWLWRCYKERVPWSLWESKTEKWRVY